MITVGAFEAKTHLSALLDKVENGEEILITKRGKPIAKLVPAVGGDAAALEGVVVRLKELRRKTTLDGLSWRELRDEGRR